MGRTCGSQQGECWAGHGEHLPHLRGACAQHEVLVLDHHGHAWHVGGSELEVRNHQVRKKEVLLPVSTCTSVQSGRRQQSL